MSATKVVSGSSGNALYCIAAICSLPLGLFFAAGAYGHLLAVWPLVVSEAASMEAVRYSLLLPGFVLGITALVNVGICGLLWFGRLWAVQIALVINLLSTLYLGYLLHRGVADHPIGIFLAMVSMQVVLLVAIRAGLVWPSSESE